MSFGLAVSVSGTSGGAGARSSGPKTWIAISRSAGNYVLSLLPPPLSTGTVRADWRFVPSAQLGGDAFGYFWLDPETFVFYLFDVAGHGVGSAMHSATVMNVLRQRALPQVDFADPASVLSSLNHRFQMDGHAGLFFTMWYGVYHVPRIEPSSVVRPVTIRRTWSRPTGPPRARSVPEAF